MNEIDQQDAIGIKSLCRNKLASTQNVCRKSDSWKCATQQNYNKLELEGKHQVQVEDD